MSSFWNFFGGKDENEKPEEGAEEQKPPPQASSPPPAKQPSQPPREKPHMLQEPKVVVPQLSAKPMPKYGIDDAIKLMRTLPVDENVDLVVRVIKRTLESLDVKVPDIVDDAKKRQDALRTKIAEYQAAIVQFEREIDARRHEIGRLEDELAETTTVRERLELAEATPFSMTPTPAKSSTSPAATTGASKKIEFPVSSAQSSPPSGRTAPPLPAFRPKLGGPEAPKQKAPSIPPPPEPPSSPALTKDKKEEKKEAKPADDDEEMPVESRDLEKVEPAKDKETDEKKDKDKSDKDRSDK